MPVSDTHNKFTESGYDSGTWQARHAIARGIIIVFSCIFLLFKGLWGGVVGCLGSIHKGWEEDIKPLFSKNA